MEACTTQNVITKDGCIFIVPVAVFTYLFIFFNPHPRIFVQLIFREGERKGGRTGRERERLIGCLPKMS